MYSHKGAENDSLRKDFIELKAHSKGLETQVDFLADCEQKLQREVDRSQQRDKDIEDIKEQ